MTKQALSSKQMFNLNFGSLGVQFAWALEVANMTGIYAFLHAKESNLGFLWLSLAITGLIIQPIIGYLSDRTSSKFGKRLPYIFWGVLITALCMVLLPNATSITIAVILLALFTASINTALQPFRSLVADVAPTPLHTKIYAIQTCLLGIGAVLASISPWVLVFIFGHQTHNNNHLPFEIKFSFYIGAFILIISNLWTIISSKKLIPSENKLVERNNEASSILKKIKKFSSAIIHMPKTMRRVSYVQFFTWTGVFAFIVYFTPVIGQDIFALPAGAHIIYNLHYHALLEKSVILTGLCCAVYMLTSVVFALFIPLLSKIFTRKIVHMSSLLIGGIALIITAYTHHQAILLLAMIGVGIAWSSFNSIPFAMVAHTIPEKKLGLYMGIFNIAICLPQVIVGLTLGFLLKTMFHHHVSTIIVLAGFCFIIGSVLTFFIHDKER